MASAKNLIEKIRVGPQFTLLGDTHHNDRELQGFFHSATFFQSLKEAGVKRLFLEAPRKYEAGFAKYKAQNFKNEAQAQAFVEKEIKEDKKHFSAFYKNTPGAEASARSFWLQQAYAALHGIEIHYYNFDSPGYPRLGLELDPKPRDNAFRCYASPYDALDSRLPGKKTPSLQRYKQKHEKNAQLRERLMRDDLFEKDITKKAGDEKSVVLIGSTHLASFSGLDEQYGDKAQTIYMHANRKQYQAYVKGVPPFAREAGLDLSQLADATFYDISTGQFFHPGEKEHLQLKNAKGTWAGPWCPGN